MKNFLTYIKQYRPIFEQVFLVSFVIIFSIIAIFALEAILVSFNYGLRSKYGYYWQIFGHLITSDFIITSFVIVIFILASVSFLKHATQNKKYLRLYSIIQYVILLFIVIVWFYPLVKFWIQYKPNNYSSNYQPKGQGIGLHISFLSLMITLISLCLMNILKHKTKQKYKNLSYAFSIIQYMFLLYMTILYISVLSEIFWISNR